MTVRVPSMAAGPEVPYLHATLRLEVLDADGNPTGDPTFVEGQGRLLESDQNGFAWRWRSVDGVRFRVSTGWPRHRPYADEELDAAGRRALPGRFHRPVFDGLGRPQLWICAVCYDEEECTVETWPCPRVKSGPGAVEIAKELGVEWSW